LCPKDDPQAAAECCSGQDLALNPNHIPLRLRSLVDPLAGEIEQSADKIAASASDSNVKRATIRWKIEAVPALRSALFQPDPFTAAMDTWVFLYQMADYFQTGPGRAAPGDAATVAVQTSLQMEEEFVRVVETFTKSGDVSRFRASARQWASDHPVRHALQDRESPLGRVVESDVGVSWSVGEVVAELTTTADHLHREVQIYSDHLFRQARWEGELLAMDLHNEVDLHGERAFFLAERGVKSGETAAAAVDNLAPAIKSVADVASSAPTILAAGRQAAIEAIGENLTRTMTFLQGERIAALKELRGIVGDEHLAISREVERACFQGRGPCSVESNPNCRGNLWTWALDGYAVIAAYMAAFLSSTGASRPAATECVRLNLTAAACHTVLAIWPAPTGGSRR